MPRGLSLTTPDSEPNSEKRPDPSTQYDEYATYGDAHLFRLRDVDCIGRYDDGRQCRFSARYVGVRMGDGDPRVAGFCGLHVPPSWTGDASDVDYPVFDLEHHTCRATITEETAGAAPELVRGCPYTPFVAVRGMESHWRRYCKIHTREAFLLALDPEHTVEM